MLRIEFATNNAAFGADCESRFERELARAHETVRLLKDICYKITVGYTSGGCVDTNGNKVGEWSID